MAPSDYAAERDAQVRQQVTVGTSSADERTLLGYALAVGGPISRETIDGLLADSGIQRTSVETVDRGRTRTLEDGPPRIRVSAEKGGTKEVISIQDSGIGTDDTERHGGGLWWGGDTGSGTRGPMALPVVGADVDVNGEAEAEREREREQLESKERWRRC